MEKVISEELPALAEIFHKPVMANVSGFSVSDYAKTVEKLEAGEAASRQIGWYEINISCPNVHGGGMAFGNLSAGSGRGHEGSQKNDEKADAAETFPECDGYYGNRKSL